MESTFPEKPKSKQNRSAMARSHYFEICGLDSFRLSDGVSPELMMGITGA
jgi:hypothetical protein